MSHLFYRRGRHAALSSLFKRAEAEEFAPGIHSSRATRDLPTVSRATPQTWTLVTQRHNADRAREHVDLRLVDDRYAHSWAIPKAKLPAPGEKLLAVQTFTHTPEYALNFGEHKTETIGKGYGKGTVKIELKTPTEILEANNNKVRFNTYQGRNLNEYLLQRTRNKDWLLTNTTLTREKLPGLPTDKPKYRETSPTAVDTHNTSQLMTAKVDGAHVLVYLSAKKPVRLFSYRVPDDSNRLLEHTHRFEPALRSNVPPNLDGLVLRGELYTGNDKGRSTGRVLNADVWRSRTFQNTTPLKAVIFDVARRAGKNVESLPYKEKLRILQNVHQELPFLQLPPMARTPKEKTDLLEAIRKGVQPLTQEGVVLWPLQGGAPIKAKYDVTHDVYVRKIFPEEGTRGALAGGFAYSWTPQGEIVGRVGTGFSHDLKKDMLQNPDKFIGRVARVRAQEKLPSTALRAPRFTDWHPDY